MSPAIALSPRTPVAVTAVPAVLARSHAGRVGPGRVAPRASYPSSARRAADPLLLRETCCAGSSFQPDRSRHPAGRHPLPRPVPRLADRCQARRPEGAGRDHRRRHRRQRNASCESTGRIVLDPDRLPERRGRQQPFPDDGLAALELSIQPERVTPILRTLIQPTNTRARVYGRDGTLDRRYRALAHGGQSTAARQHRRGDQRDSPARQERLDQVHGAGCFEEPIPVYQEIGGANGKPTPRCARPCKGGMPPDAAQQARASRSSRWRCRSHRARRCRACCCCRRAPAQIDKMLREERNIILVLRARALGLRR